VNLTTPGTKGVFGGKSYIAPRGGTEREREKSEVTRGHGQLYHEKKERSGGERVTRDLEE